MDAADAVRDYYSSIDAGAYEELASLLAPEFVQIRPDRTLEGRDRFVRFMRDERPMTDTRHDVDDLYRGRDGIAALGELRRDGDRLFGFVDVFEFDESGQITQLRTFTR